MKTGNTIFAGFLSHVARFITMTVLLAVVAAISPAGADQGNAAAISRLSLMYLPITCPDTSQTSDQENERLWMILKKIATRQAQPILLEEFLAAYPQSAWNASIHANLAKYYQDRGLFTKSLQEWETAWALTKEAQSGSAKTTGDFVLAHWTKLLVGLGRVDQVAVLIEQTKARSIENRFLRQVLRRALLEYSGMRGGTELGFRCGALALENLAKAVKGPAFKPTGLVRTPAPVTGFSLAKLGEMAEREGLGLVAVKWGVDRQVPVPSVVHWRTDHYAAIVARMPGACKVIDPILKTAQWLTEADIREEASGFFLTPADNLIAGTEPVGREQTARIFGRGYFNDVFDEDDGCGNGSGGGSGGGAGGGGTGGGGGIHRQTTGDGTGTVVTISPTAPCRSCGAGGGGLSGGGSGGGGDSCDTCGEDGGGAGGGPQPGDDGYYVTRDPSRGVAGMPIWEVSEPYINLWIYDRPLTYPSSRGQVTLKLAYNQRNQRAVNTSFFNFGDNWECNWLSYILDNNIVTAKLALPGGGFKDFSVQWNQQGQLEWSRDEFSKNTVDGQGSGNEGATNYTRIYPNGARDYYSFCPTNQIDGRKVLLLTCKVTATGYTNLAFIYEETNNLVLLRHVVDGDSRTNSFSYTNSAFPTAITSVRDAWSNTVRFQYNETGLLTNITDVVGLSSTFNYDTNGWMTRLLTPYGTNSFEHFDRVPDFSGDPYLYVRAIRVVDPVLATNVFLLRQTAGLLSATDTNFVIDSSVFNGDFGNHIPVPYSEWFLVGFRDSFHWGPRQATALPLDLDTISYENYLKARGRHWLHKGTGIGQQLSMEVGPSPDPTSRPEPVWYVWDYDQAQPTLEARVLPDGTTYYKWFLRDHLSRATNIVETFSTGYGVEPFTRTNTLHYSANDIDLLEVRGPGGELEAGYGYDSAHRLTSVTNAALEVTRFTYAADGKLTSRITPGGLITTNLYVDTGEYANWLQSTIDLDIGRTNAFTYYQNQVYTQTSERGLTVTNTWDALGRLLRVADPAGFVTNHYDKLDLVATTDRMNFTTHYGYDRVRRLTAVTNALTAYTLYSYCSCGGLESVRDAAGNYTSYSYDTAGRLTSTSFPDGLVRQNYYDYTGRIIRQTEGAASLTNWYNNQGVLYAVSNSYGALRFSQYDIHDRATNSLDANAIAVSSVFDDLGRVTIRSYPDGGSEKFGYSTRGLVAYTNQLGLVTRYGYDAAGRKTAETNANNEVTLFSYKPSGDLFTLTDGKSQTTTWKYDGYGRVTNKLDHLGTNLFFYAYDPNGRLTNRTSAARGSTAYRYDPVGNLTNIAYPATAAVTLRYDALNRLTNMVDASGSTAYSYDAVGQVLSEDGPWADDTVSYTYTNRLRARLTATLPHASPWEQTYGYDEGNRLYSLTSPAGGFSYVYQTNRQSLVQALNLPSGAKITNAFDSVARLTTTSLRSSQGTALDVYSYLYNPAGQRTNITRTLGDNLTCLYDNIGQLQRVIGRESMGGSSRMNERLGYGYDAAGNLNYRTNYTALLQTFNVNSLNQLTTLTRPSGSALVVSGTTSGGATNVSLSGTGMMPSTATLYGDGTWAFFGSLVVDGTNTYTAVATDSYLRKDTNTVSVYLPETVSYRYDLNGNLLSDGRRGFDYDDENQLIRVTITNSTRSDFAYDGKMRRRVRVECTWVSGAWVTNEIVRYVYDGNLVIQERHFVPQPVVEILRQVISYTRGKDLSGGLQGAGGIGGLLARSDSLSTIAFGGGGPTPHAYNHADGNGNITCLIDTNQVVVAKYLYEPFGNIISQTGPLADANLYRFSSKEFHPQSGLVYYLYRYYEPNLQRWVNRDPIAEEGGINLFQFVANTPTINTDSFGESVFDDLSDPNSKNKLDDRQLTECEKEEKQAECRQGCHKKYDDDYRLCEQMPQGRVRDRCHRAILKSLQFCIRRCNGGWYGPTPADY